MPDGTVVGRGAARADGSCPVRYGTTPATPSTTRKRAVRLSRFDENVVFPAELFPVQDLIVILALLAVATAMWTTVRAWPDLANRLACPPIWGPQDELALVTAPGARPRPVTDFRSIRSTRAPPTFPTRPDDVSRISRRR